MTNTRTPYETFGRFWPGKVNGRRILCFALMTGPKPVLGASKTFSRSEAFQTAQRAAAGELPVPFAQPNVGATLAAVLALRGLPVRSGRDEIDDETAEMISREFSVTE